MSNIMIVFNSRADTKVDLLNPGGDVPFFHIRFHPVISDTLFQSLEIFGIIIYQVNKF